MNKHVIIVPDPLDEASWSHADVPDVMEYLSKQFSYLPDTAKIYHEHIAESNDVTPTEGDAAAIAKLQDLEGTIYVVIYPDNISSVLSWIPGLRILSAAVRLLTPKPTIPASAGSQTAQSPNNELSDRQNSARLLGRIPDIYGTVRSTPDLIALPYSTYESNIEVEHAYMCVGRGQYEITDVRDGDTQLVHIAGSSLKVFGPETSPNSGTPQMTVGSPPDEPVYEVKRSPLVTGQSLRAPDDASITGIIDGTLAHGGTIWFESPNLINLDSTGTAKFTDYFATGDNIVVTNAPFTALSTSYLLDGTYPNAVVTDYQIQLDSPEIVNSDWLHLADLSGGITVGIAAKINADEYRWIGPFIIESKQSPTEVWFNFVAPNGLYAAAANQVALDPGIEVNITPLDVDGSYISIEQGNALHMAGSAVLRSQVGITYKWALFDPATADYRKMSIRVRRIQPKYVIDGAQIVDEIKWKDLYVVRPVDVPHFGDITTVQSVTQATTGALSVKSRKLNMHVTRKLPTYDPTLGVMTTSIYPTKNAADAIVALSLDPKIGRRSVGELDLPNIYQTVADVVDYFGIAEAGQFSYTFDSANMSYEESVTALASAVFCEPYRQGSVLRLHFERESDDAVLLFNHRNKAPKSEKRTMSFGIAQNFDGIEYQYVDPLDDAKVTFYVPEDQSAINPSKIQSVGVRTHQQARLQAYRAWNKLKYQREIVEFEGLRESDLLVRNNRILIADNTQTGTQDGEIEAVSGLVLSTSQKCIFDPTKTYSIFLQLADGSVDSIPATAGADAYNVNLSRAPLIPLVVESDRYLKTTYMLVSDESAGTAAFLVTEKSKASQMTTNMTCINYDARYYANDGDYRTV